ncbi:hypothetical protein ACLB2K_029444 [Fragaria x ananassa]
MQSFSDSRFFIECLFPDIDMQCMDALSVPISLLETKQARFSIGKFKAPGYDGFPAFFIQQHWNLCANDLTQVVTEAFRTSSIPQGLNHTIIALISKIEGPQHMAKLVMDCDHNLLTWKKPPENFYKLNVDGSRSSTSGKIGAGEVIRDHNGLWITGFQINLGIGAIVDAEAWRLQLEIESIMPFS